MQLDPILVLHHPTAGLDNFSMIDIGGVFASSVWHSVFSRRLWIKALAVQEQNSRRWLAGKR